MLACSSYQVISINSVYCAIDEPALVGKMSAILDSLQSNLRSLVLLHEEAVGMGATGVVDAITAGIDSHKEALLSWEESGEVRDKSPSKQDPGRRKRSATSPVDMLGKRDCRKRLSKEPEDLASSGTCREERLPAESRLPTQVHGGVAGGDFEASTRTDISGEVHGGKKTGTLGCSTSSGSQEATCEMEGHTSSTSSLSSSSTSAGVTLTGDQTKEARDLMHKLLQYFS